MLFCVLGYNYVASLLRGETENDNYENMQILKIISPEIIDRISGDLNSVVDLCHEKEVITEQDKEEVQAETERKGALAAAFMLVDKIQTKKGSWYEKLKSLAQQLDWNDIVEMLDVPEGTTNVNRKLPYCSIPVHFWKVRVFFTEIKFFFVLVGE